MNTIKEGPFPLQITNGLDFYKVTMSQVAHEKHSEASVKFTMQNRGKERLADYIDPTILENRLNIIGANGFSKNEVEFLASIGSNDTRFFTDEYLNSIVDQPLPEIQVSMDDYTNDIAITTTGKWAVNSFWETIVLSELNELYYEGMMLKNGIQPHELYELGDQRLTEKINMLKGYPGINFSDFGTRRHFSYRWQRHVVERLAQEIPNQFLGTSNIGLAKDLGLKPIGTFAHEMPMVYAGLADENGENIRESHGKMLDDWYKKYGKVLSIALTDTFGSDFFFKDFGAKRADEWNGLRHDSGDPYVFGEKAIEYYSGLGINPLCKTIVFSDGLNCDQIIELYSHFKDQINMVFGWGTTLTNDLGLKPLNIVMKATEANGYGTVKLSDVPTKHTGSTDNVSRYQEIFY